jgi:RNA polymerase sigma-70 factor (ECF subfamily)
VDDREREREQQLVSAALDGDKSAFGELVDRLKRSLFGVCMSYLRDEAEAMDQVQDTFLKAYTELSKFRRDTNFRAWVHRIARNGCIDRIRRQRVRRAGELDDQVSAESLEEGALPSVGTFGRSTPLQEMARNQLGARLQAAVDLLPEAHRMCVIMCDVEGMSYQEIAEALDIPKGTVMSRLFYARRKLQAELHDFRPTDGGMP